ncbi:GMC oxidoreductase-domain-containing protein [Neurospora tetraspora]|uniref:GMC oxidoreductase-domain-containing protein n=1 Tax=Neurospora tetraspora TaxID=94610 RepID=A0AAE0JBT4_9PEZI|nr:GMC oxidoreductase-domain-containing protein [Neurospora tetraspora]
MWPFAPSYPTVHAADIHDQTFDYIIVGGGTAGCVLASRLSESPNVSVLLLEKGRVHDNFLSRIPLLSQNFEFPFLQSVRRDSDPIPAANGRRAALWTAEALGGATRINALLWTRGVAGGYNAWAEEYGLEHWSWDMVDPWFRKTEDVVKTRKPGFELGCIPFVEKAARRVGLPVGEGVNDAGASAQGCFVMDQTVDGKGQRVSAYKAWLPRETARERKGLKICTGVVASTLFFSKDGTRVTGVRVREGGREYTVKARREVIVCSGTICTPQLLMLSGIGPRHHLESLEIPVIHDLPAVGQGLSDHTSIPIIMELPRKHTLHCLESAFVFLWHLLLYLFFGKGLLVNGTTPRSIFVHTAALDENTMTVRHNDDSDQDTMDASLPQNIPDVEIMINPVNCLTVNISGKSLFTWYTTLIQPYSRGHVKLASSDDPLADPKICYPMMSDDRDRVTMRKAVRFTMRLAEEFTNTGYPYEAPLMIAPGMDLVYLDALYEPKTGLLQRLQRRKKPADEEPVPVPGKEDLLTGAGQPSVSTSTNSEPNKQHFQKSNWRTIMDNEIDAYASRRVSQDPECAYDGTGGHGCGTMR